MGGSTWAEFEYEALMSGGGIGIEKAGANLNFSLQYVQKKLSITQEYGPGNYLTFNLYATTTVGSASKVKLSLRLNKAFSQVDGIALSTLMGSQPVDLTDTLMSNCWREFVSEEGEVAPPPSGTGGSGTLEDPFDGSGNEFSPGDLCIVRQNVTTCSETEDGIRTCTKTQLSHIESCSIFSP